MEIDIDHLAMKLAEKYGGTREAAFRDAYDVEDPQVIQAIAQMAIAKELSEIRSILEQIAEIQWGVR